jgi:pseudouridine-5'-phosphate glycosidase
MPYPRNVEMAVEVEGIVRDGGAVPATIAVLDGRPRIGLGRDDLELLASDPDVLKVSVRDLPYVVARGLHGATTVASTMRLAALAGIPVFVTGGLGGVHRGAQQTFDISADLTELGGTPVAVVSAGVKSILDIGLTLEVLETQGVPVLVHGSDEFPSFFSRSSGHAAPMRVDSAAEVAAVMRSAWSLGLRSGIVVANPIGRDPRRRDRRDHRAGARRSGPAGHHRQGRHAVPPRPDRRDHRRRQPDRQHRARAQQRPARRRDRGGVLRVTSSA